MKNLISAIQFITVLPTWRKMTYEPVGMIPYFPVVGLIVGVLLAGFDWLAGQFWPPHAVAVLDVLFLVFVTGAFHLDGLGDSADGLFSHRPREKALLIMKDSRMGAMGLVAVICCVMLKWAGISSLTADGFDRALIFIIVPSFSRAAQLAGIRMLEYGRPEGGTAGNMFNEKLKLSAFSWCAVPVALSLLLGMRGLWIDFCFILVVAGNISFYRRKMGCVTGDMLGAMTEITEPLLFLLAAVVLR